MGGKWPAWRERPPIGNPPHFLRGEEWVENPIHGFGCHADPGVRYLKLHISPGLQLELGRGNFEVRHVAGSQCQRPAVGHGVGGVDKQIQEGLLQLAFIGIHRAKARVQIRPDDNVFAGAAEGSQHLRDQFVQQDRLGLRRPLACIAQQLGG